MAEQIIKDKRNMKIGVLKEQGGATVVYDKMNRMLGKIKNNVAYNKLNVKLAEYKPTQNATFDKSNRKIGNGNILLSFYFEELINSKKEVVNKTAEQIIKDKRNMKIGVLKEQGGATIVYDKMNRMLGKIKDNVAYNKLNVKLAEYKPTQNATFDKSNRKIGNGNILLSFYFENV